MQRNITDTIGIVEQRHLLEISSELARALTKDEFTAIMIIYKKVIDRIVEQSNIK